MYTKYGGSEKQGFLSLKNMIKLLGLISLRINLK
jgi:hypothetical protein